MAKPEAWTETELGPDDRIVRTSCGECGCKHYGVIRYLAPELYHEAEEQYLAQRATRRARRRRLLRLGREAERQTASRVSSAAAGAPIPAVAVSPAKPSGKVVGNGPEPAALF